MPHFTLEEASGSPLDPTLAGLVEHPRETAVLYTTMLVRAANHNRPVGTVNHTSWAVSDAKAQPLLSLDRQQWSSAVPQPTTAQTLKVPWFRESGPGKWLELVINNFDDKGHPFHLVSDEPSARGVGTNSPRARLQLLRRRQSEGSDGPADRL